MSVDISRGGLLVTLAIFGVIIYEFRTVLEFVGVNVPLIPYMTAVFVLGGAVIYWISLTGGWRTETPDDDPS
ncbi:MAG: CbaC protein [Natrialbaceae archaeon]